MKTKIVATGQIQLPSGSKLEVRISGIEVNDPGNRYGPPEQCREPEYYREISGVSVKIGNVWGHDQDVSEFSEAIKVQLYEIFEEADEQQYLIQNPMQ